MDRGLSVDFSDRGEIVAADKTATLLNKSGRRVAQCVAHHCPTRDPDGACAKRGPEIAPCENAAAGLVDVHPENCDVGVNKRCLMEDPAQLANALIVRSRHLFDEFVV